MSSECARYTFTAGSRPEGVAVYDDDTSVTSHHDTDPARGTHGAFDLVRLHRFGHLDKDQPTDAPMAERPSFKAMCEFAETLPEIRAARGGLEDLGPLPEAPAVGAPIVSKFSEIIDAEAFADEPDLEPNDQIPGILPTQGTGQLFGPSGAGKSFVGLKMAADIALGRDFHSGRKARQGAALYVVAEGQKGFKRRIRALRRHYGTGFAGRLKVLRLPVNLFKPSEGQELVKRLRDALPAATLCIFDTKWRCSLGAKEDSADDTQIIFGTADYIARELKCFCLLISHTGYDTSRVRGSSSQYAACDVELSVTRDGGSTMVASTKNKDSESGAELSFKSVIVDLGYNSHGEHESSLVLEPVDVVEHALAFKPNGKIEKAVYDYVQECGETQFAKEQLVAEVAKKCGSRPSTVRRAVETSLSKSLFLGNGDDLTVRAGIVRDNTGWLE